MLAVLAGWSIGQLAIAAVILVAVVAIVWYATRAMGVTIPDWVVKIFWVVVIAVVAILAIKFLLSL